jgi:putative chitinase
MEPMEITTVTRAAAFIGQLAHESFEFNALEELSTGMQYEGRRVLGNMNPGDGARFKGRGWIQLTGRYNYELFGEKIGLDLVNNPGLAALPENAAKIAVAYWMEKKLNSCADELDFGLITKLINGGMNGYSERLWYFRRALEVLGITANI